MGNKFVGCVSAPIDDADKASKKEIINTQPLKPERYPLGTAAPSDSDIHELSMSYSDKSMYSSNSSVGLFSIYEESAGDLVDETNNDEHDDMIMELVHDDEANDIIFCPFYNGRNVKLLFLDVDGVLNNPKTKWDDYSNGLNQKLLKYLKLIILKTGCKIILSTTWRLNPNAKAILLHALKTRIDINIEDVVIGQTASFKHRGKHRTNEIEHFLKKHENTLNVLNWVALDDLALNKYDKHSHQFMDKHFVRTDRKIGISPQNALSCIDILNEYDHALNPYAYLTRYSSHSHSIRSVSSSRGSPKSAYSTASTASSTVVSTLSRSPSQSSLSYYS